MGFESSSKGRVRQPSAWCADCAAPPARPAPPPSMPAGVAILLPTPSREWYAFARMTETALPLQDPTSTRLCRSLEATGHVLSNVRISERSINRRRIDADSGASIDRAEVHGGTSICSRSYTCQ